MATITAKTVTDNTLTLGNREGFLRKLDFGDWTVIRLLAFVAGVNNTAGENTASASETVAVSSSADRIFFGLKNTDDVALPGVAGSLYLGLTTATTRSSEAGANSFHGTSFTALAACGYYGTTLVGGTTAEEFFTSNIGFPTVTGTSAYSGWYGLQITVSNRGTATQSMSMVVNKSDTVSGTDYSAARLLALASAGAWAGGAKVIAWNDGAAARVIPDGFFIRMPFYNNRIRISALRAIRVS